MILGFPWTNWVISEAYPASFASRKRTKNTTKYLVLLPIKSYYFTRTEFINDTFLFLLAENVYTYRRSKGEREEERSRQVHTALYHSHSHPLTLCFPNIQFSHTKSRLLWPPILRFFVQIVQLKLKKSLRPPFFSRKKSSPLLFFLKKSLRPLFLVEKSLRPLIFFRKKKLLAPFFISTTNSLTT